MKKTILIKCKGSIDLELDDLVPFQGELKQLSKSNYVKLRKSILDLGFSAPPFVWKSRDDGQWKILDSHQRVRVLIEMRDAEGFKIPKLPCVEIEAENEHVAKKKILAFASQFGQITNASLFEFASLNSLDLEAIDSFNFPEIKMDMFKAEFFDMPLEMKEPEPRGDGELKDSHLKNCPNCGVLID